MKRKYNLEFNICRKNSATDAEIRNSSCPQAESKTSG